MRASAFATEAETKAFLAKRRRNLIAEEATAREKTSPRGRTCKTCDSPVTGYDSKWCDTCRGSALF